MTKQELIMLLEDLPDDITILDTDWDGLGKKSVLIFNKKQDENFIEWLLRP